jgi:trimethylamine--corrinoid protein Co-methyltransferase
MVISLEQTLVDVEIFRMCRKVHDGIAVEDDRWLVDVLARVGPGGCFLGEPSTRANLRGGEWFLAGLGTHSSHQAWLEAGRPELLGEARAKVDELLAGHTALPLSDEVERELEGLRKRAEEGVSRAGLRG